MAQKFKQYKQFMEMSALFDKDAPPKVEGWLCKRKDCLYAHKGYRNFPERVYCNGCYRSKAQAQKAENNHNKTDEDTAISETTNKEQKKREARARKRAGREAHRQAVEKEKHKADPVPLPAPASIPGPVASAISQAAAIPPVLSRLALPTAVTDELEFLFPAAAGKVVASLALEVVPSPVEAKCPSATMAKFIGERGPTAKTARKHELEKTIERLKSALTSLQGGGDGVAEVAESLKSKIEVHEKELSKIAKDQPSQDHERMAIAEARSSYEVAMQARLDREVKGASKSAERQKERLEHIAALKREVSKLEEGTIKAYDENAAKHKARAESAAALDKEVLALFDKKLATLTEPQAMQGITAGAQAPQQGPPNAGPLALSLVAAANLEVPTNTLEELAEARKVIAVLSAKLETSINTVKMTFEKAFEDIQPDDLPKPAVADRKALETCGGIFRTLDEWSKVGAVTMFDWKALDLTVNNGTDCKVMAKELVGGLWDRWYVDDEPDDHSVVPRQLGLLIHYVLGMVKEEYEKEEAKQAINKIAKEGSQALRESAKRLRISK